MRKRELLIGAVFLTAIVALGVGQSMVEKTASLQAQSGDTVEAPIFEVDPLWPKPLPNHWVLGTTIGVAVDSRDHVLHRAPSGLRVRR